MQNPSFSIMDARFWLACACLAASMTLVGSYVALSKPLLAVFPVFLLAWLRFGIGAVAMSGWVRKPMNEPSLSRHTKGLLFLESLLGNFLFSVFMLYGMKLTTAVSAGIIMALIPAVVALLSAVFLRERISRQTLLGIALAVLGIALYALLKNELVTQSNKQFEPDLYQYWLGNGLIFCAVVCEAAYAVIGKRLTGDIGPKRIASLINLWGFALSTPFGIWLALSFDFGAVPIKVWALLAFYALAASVWTVWLWMTGLKHVPASQAGVFTVMLPLSTALTGVLVLGESLEGLQIVAFALALCGVVLSTMQQRSAPPSSTSSQTP
jgi:drug/metabolite transporter (DMT)-like permease